MCHARFNGGDSLTISYVHSPGGSPPTFAASLILFLVTYIHTILEVLDILNHIEPRIIEQLLDMNGLLVIIGTDTYHTLIHWRSYVG